MKDSRHVVLIYSFVGGILLLVIGASAFLRPDSFGVHGHYRWNAMGDVLAQPVKAPGTANCAPCHPGILHLHGKDAHNGVPCVDCHGAGADHIAFHAGDSVATGISAVAARMPKEYQLEGCLYCHRRLNARPRDFPQVDKDEHYRFLRVTDASTPCISCHNPHEPIFLLTEARSAKLHPIVSKCTECHARQPERDMAGVVGHPTVWQCRDCHASIVQSFEQRSHAGHIECRTCHLFHREDERSGRMYKNGNAMFCLLCHESAPFKDSSMPPKISWPAHLGSLGYLSAMNQKICLQCHWNNIHEMKPSADEKPHPPTWTKDHRAYLAKNFSGRIAAAKCGDCHAASYCRDCHKVDMPHPSSFIEDHAGTVRKLGMKTCRNCHEPDACGSCHDIPQ